MPTVPAGNLPYTGVPTAEPQVGGPSNFQNIRATADEFGAIGGQELEKLGLQIGRASDQLAATQTFLSTVEADKAGNEYRDYENKVLYGDPAKPGDTGFYGLKGENAVKAFPNIRDSLSQARNNLRARLGNQTAALKFDDETRRQNAITMSQVGRHFVAEATHYKLEVAKAGVESGMNGAAQALARGAEAEAEAQVGHAMKSFIDGAQAQGITDPDYINNGLLKIRGDWVRQKVDDLKQKDPVAAQIYFENNIDALPHAEVIQLRDQLGKASQAQQAQIDAGLLPGTTSAQRGAGQGHQTPYGFSRTEGKGFGAHDMSGTGEGHVAPKAERVEYIRKGAIARGLNPDAIIATVNTEGLHVYKGDHGKSFGDFQLYTGGGMGNEAEAAGINIRDPKTWKEQADFAMDRMAEHKGDTAWFAGQWHGPARYAPWAVDNFSNPAAAAAENEPRTAAAPAGAGGYKAFGDSLAGHLINHAGVSGKAGNGEKRGRGIFEKEDDSTAVAGIGPVAVKEILRNAPDKDIKGQDIVISTGASNVNAPGALNDGNMQTIAEQVYWAKYKGAKSITLLGVANPFGAGEARNQQLAQVAAANGAAFAGAIPAENWAPDKVHTKRPAGMLEQVKAAQSAPAPVAAGDIIRDSYPNDPRLNTPQGRAMTGGGAQPVDTTTTLTGTAPAVPGVQLASNEPDQMVAQPIKPLPKLNFALPEHENPTDLPDAAVPGMAEGLEKIMKNVPADNVLARQRAVQALRKQLNMDYQNQQRQLKLRREEVAATSEATKSQYMTKMPGQAFDESQINADTRMTTSDRENLVRYQRSLNQADPDPVKDKANWGKLLARITAPFGTEGKITSDQPIFDAMINKDIGRESGENLLKHLYDKRNGVLGTAQANLEKAFTIFKPTILGPGNLAVIDTERDGRFWNFEQAAKKMLSDHLTAGKDPNELFVPTDPKNVYSSPIGKLAKQYEASTRVGATPPAPAAGGAPANFTTKEGVKAEIGRTLTLEQAKRILRERFGEQFSPDTPTVPVR